MPYASRAEAHEGSPAPTNSSTTSAVAPQVAAQCRGGIPAASRCDASRRFPYNSRATVSAGARSQMAPFKTDEPMHWTTSSCCRDDRVIAAVSKMPMATPGGPKPWQSASSSVVGGRADILQASLNEASRMDFQQEVG